MLITIFLLHCLLGQKAPPIDYCDRWPKNPRGQDYLRMLYASLTLIRPHDTEFCQIPRSGTMTTCQIEMHISQSSGVCRPRSDVNEESLRSQKRRDLQNAQISIFLYALRMFPSLKRKPSPQSSTCSVKTKQQQPVLMLRIW
ncbi:hypothetical protein F4777DRAFT_476839 [Nemania sp. FL0916]|nr:hypothetical protein F4777DRAFT_476839 [Nemania sp. FL0916]